MFNKKVDICLPFLIAEKAKFIPQNSKLKTHQIVDKFHFFSIG